MITNLIFGLPGDRPGGLVLTIFAFVAAGGIALVLGFVYASIGVIWKRASLALQAVSAFLRGIPVLLLAFLTAHLSGLTPGGAGLTALCLYSFAHVGEIVRSFLAAYPAHMADQARVIGMLPVREWLLLRIPWTLRHAWGALSTHWISLLKDTGALVIVGVGELTTVAKALGETPAGIVKNSNHRPGWWLGPDTPRRIPETEDARFHRAQAEQDPTPLCLAQACR